MGDRVVVDFYISRVRLCAEALERLFSFLLNGFVAKSHTSKSGEHSNGLH